MKLRYWSRMLAGAVCAILASWLGLALFFYVALSLILSDALSAPIFAAEWMNWALLIGAGLLVFVVTFALLSFVAGLICAFFWNGVATKSNYERWGFWVWLICLAPAIWAYGLGFWAFLPSLFTFYKAVDFGVEWWPRRGWRHLLGTTNQWEHESEERNG